MSSICTSTISLPLRPASAGQRSAITSPPPRTPESTRSNALADQASGLTLEDDDKEDEESSLRDQKDAPIDIFQLGPETALKLMCDSLETIVAQTGDIPPAPAPVLVRLPSQPSSSPSNQKSIIQPEKENKPNPNPIPNPIRPSPLPSSPPPPPPPTTSIIMADQTTQDRTITRRFYSKTSPGISIKDYTLRIHRYCPLSTAVILATSLYIHRLVLVERVLCLTPRNVHRLILAGLRVAMKALEDLTYTHTRFAKVGGVCPAELGRLEIGFCFVVGFELKVDEDALRAHARFLMRRVEEKGEGGGGGGRRC